MIAPPGSASPRVGGPRLARYRFFWWSLHLASFIGLATIVFHHYAEVLFYRYDGTFILAMAHAQPRWMALYPGFSSNFLEGLGDIWIPTATQWFPGFAIGRFVGNDETMPWISCVVFAVEFVTTTAVLARCLGAGLVTALAGAWLGALVTLPFFIPTLDDWRVWGNPHFMTAIGATSLALCAFLSIGRQGIGRDFAAAAAISVLLAYLATFQPNRVVMTLPIFAFFGLAALISAASRRERWRKALVAAAIAAIFLICFGRYLYALFLYAKTTDFWADLPSFPVSWRQQSFMISEGRGYGIWIWSFCLAGAALAGARERGRLRYFAFAFLLFVALQQLVLGAGSLMGLRWSGPPSAYIDLFALPFYALFGGYLAVGWWSERASLRYGVRLASPSYPGQLCLPCISR